MHHSTLTAGVILPRVAKACVREVRVPKRRAHHAMLVQIRLVSPSLPEPPIAIVRARKEELAGVRHLAERVWRVHYPGIIDREQIEYMLERGYALDALAAFLDAPTCGLELAKSGAEMVGLAAWYVTDRADEAKLDKLYVLPSRQRQGLGGRLIGCVAGRAASAGARTLILNVNRNNVQAVRAYEKHGFAIRDAVVLDIGHGFVMDDYVMAKSI